MSLKRCPPKLCRILILALLVGIGSTQISFGREVLSIRVALKSLGFSVNQVQRIVSRVDRTYSDEYVEHHVKWLQSHGVTDFEKLAKVLPVALPHPIQGDLDKRMAWLEKQGVTDTGKLVSSHPDLFADSIGSLEDKVQWLNQQGFKSTKKLISAYPDLLALSIKGDLDPTLVELKEHWRLGILDIEKSPQLLGTDLLRVLRLRLLLDKIAKTAEEPHFDLETLAPDLRKDLIRTGSASQLIRSLKDVKSIGLKREEFARLHPFERKMIADLYRNHKIHELLSHIAEAQGKIPNKPREIAIYVGALREKLTPTVSSVKTDELIKVLKDEGFAYIEREEILDVVDGRTSTKELKDHIEWLKKQGVTTSERLTRALLVVARRSTEESLDPKVKWLKDLKVSSIGEFIGDHPEFLSHTLKDLQDKADWLKSKGVKDVGKLVNAWPPVLRLSLEENLKPTAEWLERQGVQDLTKTLSSQPSILGLSVEENLKPTVAWLKKQGVEDIGKLLSTNPRVITHSVKDTLEPRAEWFRKQGIQNVGKLIDSFPALLGYSIENNDDTFSWLAKHGVENPGKVIGSFPQVLSYSIPNKLDPKADWVRKHFTDRGKVISAFPVILGLSIEENLDPKLAEFKNHWGIGVQVIEKDPMLLIGSLDRIKDVRLLLDDIAKLAGDSHFVLTDLPLEQRTVMIQKVAADQIFDRLKKVGAIHAERKSLKELSAHERSVVASLYRDREFLNKLLLRGISSKTIQAVSCHVDFLRTRLHTQ
ncbi:MAG: hypothetical protein ACJ763_15365 [Bdellovibrionia bacterium]